ncbi:MAG: winged helix-turn-helix domain-containing protein [Candidatus Hodarchaeales archaeon]|jgi:molybdate transport repressor ModE-like protein
MSNKEVNDSSFDIQPLFKLWLEIQHEKESERKTIIGKGKARILEAIKSEGSIKGAAEKLDLSFKTVWRKSKELRRAGPGFLMEVSKGGSDKGGTLLTPAGQRLLDTYKQLEDALERMIKRYEFTISTEIKIQAQVKKVIKSEEGGKILELELPSTIRVELPRSTNLSTRKELSLELDARLVQTNENSDKNL